MKNMVTHFLNPLFNLIILICPCIGYTQQTSPSSTSPVNFVNPFIGTQGTQSSIEGRTHPGAQVPFGMVSVCPFNAYDTALAKNIADHSRFQAPYFKDRTHISGFSHVNISGVGCPDMGAILLMPTTGDIQTRPDQYFSQFENEKASPGYYSTLLTRYGIKAEVSATTRTGISKYTFPEGRSNVLINLGLAQTNLKGGTVKVLSNTRVEGFKNVGTFCGSNTSQTVYFAAEFNKQAKVTGVWNGSRKFENYPKEMTGCETGAFFTFQTKKDAVIEVKVGISYVSTENAWLNLNDEQHGFDFDKVRNNAEEQWDRELSKIRVEGGNREDKINFYTALYHSLIHPNIFSDVNGEYPAMRTHKTVKAIDYKRYTVYSLWDTYRNLHQLLTLVYPDRQLDMIKSMLAMYEEGGWLPKWELAGNETYVMVGDPAVPVIADSYIKGINQFDADLAYQAMKKGAITPEEKNDLRPGIDAYLEYGYIPMDMKNKRDVWGPVSTTQEYNIADFALSQMAISLGKNVEAKLFHRQSMGYMNFFNPQNGFLQPKLKDGSWYEPFDPEKGIGWPGGPGYVEGNAWHYSFFVPHDIPGLIKLFGSKDRFINKLQQCFDEDHFSMSNEPDITYPFLFNYVKGEEWRTQKAVRKVIYDNYKNAPTGLPGNDDCGTMSAWLVFAMIGIYPDCPAIPEYQITSPVFDKITIKLNRDFYPATEFIIKANNNSIENVFIQSIKLNGVPYDNYTINHDKIIAGGKLEINVSDTL